MHALGELDNALPFGFSAMGAAPGGDLNGRNYRPVADGVGEGIDLDALLGTFRDTETGEVFITAFDERRGVIVRRDLLTLMIDGDGQVPELFERRIEAGRYERVGTVEEASAWAVRDTAARIQEGR